MADGPLSNSRWRKFVKRHIVDDDPTEHTPSVWTDNDTGRLLLDWPDDWTELHPVHRDVIAILVDKVNEARHRAEQAGDHDGWTR